MIPSPISPPAERRPAQSPIDIEKFLDSLIVIESAGNWMAVGQCGELGGFQFRERAWHCFTRKPFSFAAIPDEARPVAREYVETIIRALESKGIVATPYLVAITWNAGIKTALAQIKPRSVMCYAQRVNDLYLELRNGPKVKGKR